jgi:Holliday junction resolvase
MDLIGREFKGLSKNKKVDVSHLPKGMYLLIDAKYDSEKRVLLKG